MNRVRVVAVTAVVLGVAVVAGTQFQKSRDIADLDASSASVSPAPQPSVLPQSQSASIAGPFETNSAPTLREPTLARASAETAMTPGVRSGTISLLPPAASASASAEAADQPTRSAPQAAPRLSTASILPASDLLPAPQAEGTLQLAQAALEVSVEDTAIAPLDIAPLDSELEAELAACAVWIVVTPSVGAMLDASVYAPCDRDAEVRVSHAGLNFDTHVGADGQLMLMVPALVDDATLTVTFADGRTQSDRTFVEDLRSVERVALQWTGPAELSLHAYEFGAQYGEVGHVFAGNPMAAGAGEHGFLTDLGDPSIADAHRVQVYSYPSGQSSRSGSVTLEIEVPITEASCGQPLEADSIEMYGAAPARSRVIHLDMPACDGTGGYVVLPGVLPDLQIAALR